MTKVLELKKSSGNSTPMSPPNCNSLPAEVLAHIFQLVSTPHTQPCFLEREKYSDYPNYPETLLRVCSRWRQIALASPRLWSHIDIVLSPPAGQKVLERANVFLERAGRASLDIRILDKPIRSWRSMYTRSNDEFSNEECDDFPEESDEEDPEDSGEFEGGESDGDSDDSDDSSTLGAFKFLPSFPTHAPIRSIEFVIASSRRHSASYTPVLAHCFENCLPGTLVKLVLRGESSDMRYILPSTKHSEAVWLPITTLHASGEIRPPWESNAFKGLTDLRLSRFGYDSIPESKFVDILRSSPKLRILQFHLTIAQPSPLDKPVEPIPLDDLEVLDLIQNHHDQKEFETLTRWIAPNQKPLRLSLWSPLNSDPVKNFFRRSNVTELHVRLHGNSADSLEKIIDLSPQLRVLAVDGCGGSFNPTSATKAGDALHSFTRIDTLHLQYCSTQFGSLQRMVQKRSIRTLTMWSSHIRRGQFGGVEDEEILALCPNSKILKRKEFTNMEKWIKSIV